LCNSLCGPWTKKFGDPWLRPSGTSQVFSTLGVEALNRDLLVIPHWLWLVDFTSKADKLKAGQTREGIQKTELSSGLGEPLL